MGYQGAPGRKEGRDGELSAGGGVTERPRKTARLGSTPDKSPNPLKHALHCVCLSLSFVCFSVCLSVFLRLLFLPDCISAEVSANHKEVLHSCCTRKRCRNKTICLSGGIVIIHLLGSGQELKQDSLCFLKF